MVGSLGCHGRGLMRDLPRGLDLQATVSATEIVQPHREPTHPAVVPRRFGNGQGLPGLALIAHATGPVVTLYHTRVDDVIAEEIQDMLEVGFAMHDPYLSAFNATPFIVFFALPIGSALGPAHNRAPGPACGAVRGGRIATAEGVEDGGLIPVIGIGEDRWQMPRTEPLLGSVDQGCGLRLGPFANDERHEQCTVRRDGGMVPQVPCLGALLHRTALLLFLTKLHCSSNSTARGVMACTRWSCTRSAWRPAIRSSRATVSLEMCTRRAVARIPHPSPK